MSKAPRSACSRGASPRPSSAGDTLAPPPVETALGALLGHITGGAEAETYQPMNVNFGLFPPIEGRTKKADRKRMYTARARGASTTGWRPSFRRRPPPAPAGRRHARGAGRLRFTAVVANSRGSARPTCPCRRRELGRSS